MSYIDLIFESIYFKYENKKGGIILIIASLSITQHFCILNMICAVLNLTGSMNFKASVFETNVFVSSVSYIIYYLKHSFVVFLVDVSCFYRCKSYMVI